MIFRRILPDAMIAAGGVCIGFGLWSIYPPVFFVWLGAMLVFASRNMEA